MCNAVADHTENLSVQETRQANSGSCQKDVVTLGIRPKSNHAEFNEQSKRWHDWGFALLKTMKLTAFKLFMDYVVRTCSLIEIIEISDSLVVNFPLLPSCHAIGWSICAATTWDRHRIKRNWCQHWFFFKASTWSSIAFKSLPSQVQFLGAPVLHWVWANMTGRFSFSLLSCKQLTLQSCVTSRFVGVESSNFEGIGDIDIEHLLGHSQAARWF